MHELSLHVLDLVQNSLEAGANDIFLEIIEDRQKNELMLRVTDNGKGMHETLLRQVRDPFVSTRKTRKVGLGLPLIDMTAQQAGGSLDIESKPGKGTVVKATYCLSHIDCPPLGKMGATLKALLIGNPGVNIRYYHQVDNQTFSLSTQEIRDILHDIPLTHPDVLLWLDGHIRENLARLYGGVT